MRIFDNRSTRDANEAGQRVFEKIGIVDSSVALRIVTVF
jgi:hypothetical protein